MPVLLFYSIKMFAALVLSIVGIAAFLAGYTKYPFVLRMIFGKERVKEKGTKWLTLYLYIAAVIMLIIALLLIL
jgi:hypothetical protein